MCCATFVRYVHRTLPIVYLESLLTHKIVTHCSAYKIPILTLPRYTVARSNVKFGVRLQGVLA